jgi:hypothetical protein
VVGDHEIPLAQIGTQSCMAQVQPPSLPEQDAVLTVDIDGQVSAHKIHLVNGVTPSCREIDFFYYPAGESAAALSRGRCLH